MEKTILRVEEEIEALQKDLEKPEILQNSLKTKELYEFLAEKQQKLENLFIRWQELDERKKL